MLKWQYAELTIYSVEVRLSGGGAREVDVAQIEEVTQTRRIEDINVLTQLNELGSEGWEIGEPKRWPVMPPPMGQTETMYVGGMYGEVQATSSYFMKRQAP